MPDKKTGLVWIAMSQFALLGSNFLLLKLLTTNLSVAAFGYYSLCMSIVLFARQVIYDPISIVAAKKYASMPDSASEGFLTVRHITDRLTLLLLFFALLYYIACEIATKPHAMANIVFCCLIYLFANGAHGIYLNLLNLLRERRVAAISTSVDSVLKVVCVYLVYRSTKGTLFNTLLPIALSAATVFFLLRSLVIRLFPLAGTPCHQTKEFAGYLLKSTLPLYIPTIFAALKSVADRWVLATFIGVNELAAYSVLLQFGYLPMILLIGVVQTFIAPTIYRLSATGGPGSHAELTKYLNKIVFYTLIFMCAGCIAGFLLAELIFIAFTGENYHSSAKLLPFFIASGGLTAIAGILNVAVVGTFDSKVVANTMIASVLLNIIITSLFILTLGFIGSIFGLLAGSAASAFIYWFKLYSRPTHSS